MMVEITIELDKARTDSTKYINQIIKNGNQNTKDKFNSILEEQTEFATKLYETLKNIRQHMTTVMMKEMCQQNLKIMKN